LHFEIRLTNILHVLIFFAIYFVHFGMHVTIYQMHAMHFDVPPLPYSYPMVGVEEEKERGKKRKGERKEKGEEKKRGKKRGEKERVVAERSEAQVPGCEALRAALALGPSRRSATTPPTCPRGYYYHGLSFLLFPLTWHVITLSPCSSCGILLVVRPGTLELLARPLGSFGKLPRVKAFFVIAVFRRNWMPLVKLF
jgi:hypothetical protein